MGGASGVFPQQAVDHPVEMAESVKYRPVSIHRPLPAVDHLRAPLHLFRKADHRRKKGLGDALHELAAVAKKYVQIGVHQYLHRQGILLNLQGPAKLPLVEDAQRPARLRASCLSGPRRYSSRGPSTFTLTIPSSNA